MHIQINVSLCAYVRKKHAHAHFGSQGWDRCQPLKHSSLIPHICILALSQRQAGSLSLISLSHTHI